MANLILFALWFYARIGEDGIVWHNAMVMLLGIYYLEHIHTYDQNQVSTDKVQADFFIYTFALKTKIRFHYTRRKKQQLFLSDPIRRMINAVFAWLVSQPANLSY